jgi:hypothetical protein
MAQIVAVQLLSHTSHMRTHLDRADPSQVRRVVSALDTLRVRLEQARPDVVIMVGTDHVNNFFLNHMPALCIGVADAYHGPARAERSSAGAPRRLPGGGAFGAHLLETVFADGVTCSYAHELELDHSLMIPLSYLLPDRALPFIPIIQNCVAPPLPPLETCWKLGRSIRAAVERWPAHDRVAVVGTGGLSHWVGTPEMGQINQDWDRRVLELLTEGRAEELASWGDAEILPAGNGAQELRNWVTALGAMGGKPRVDVLAYEPIPEWLTGIGVANVPLDGLP